MQGNRKARHHCTIQGGWIVPRYLWWEGCYSRLKGEVCIVKGLILVGESVLCADTVDSPTVVEPATWLSPRQVHTPSSLLYTWAWLVSLLLGMKRWQLCLDERLLGSKNGWVLHMHTEHPTKRTEVELEKNLLLREITVCTVWTKHSSQMTGVYVSCVVKSEQNYSGPKRAFKVGEIFKE